MNLLRLILTFYHEIKFKQLNSNFKRRYFERALSFANYLRLQIIEILATRKNIACFKIKSLKLKYKRKFVYN